MRTTDLRSIPQDYDQVGVKETVERQKQGRNEEELNYLRGHYATYCTDVDVVTSVRTLQLCSSTARDDKDS